MDGDPQNFRPPVLVGERVAWMGSGSGLPQTATVRWIGRIPEITTGWTVGIELDNAMPVGGIDGTWRKRQLFSCEPKHGLLVPIDKIMKQSSLMKTRHNIGEKFYDEGHKPNRQPNRDLIRKLSLPQSASSREFISRVLPAGDEKSVNEPNPVGLSFKVAATQIQKPQFVKQTSLDSKTAPLTVANVRTLEKINELPDNQTSRLQTFDELEKFKKHLDDLVKLQNSEFGTKGRKKKLGRNPESLYELAQPVAESEKALFLRVIGEKKTEEKKLEIREAESLYEQEFTADELKSDDFERNTAEEVIEESFCNERVLSAAVQVYEAEIEEESLTQPTPTIRRKRQKELTAPIPSPRRKSQDVLLEDTASVLYEPVFLKQVDMSDVRGTFRRIDEDELEKRTQPPRRLLTSSVSVPVSPRKGLFSFLRWFKKKPDLDLDDFNAPSVTSSPLFTRSRLANAGSVDTLYSIATVSSFAFVSGAQYQSRLSSDKRKKRRAPAPPRDVSLPSTLETRARQQHRRSVSESYKDKRSGAFAHVNGKRKAPPPPPQPAPEKLYPSLPDGTLRKKRPAPLPPEVKSEPAPDENIVCNDTLRLERGVLKPNKATCEVPKIAPTSPVSPRPWYKRKSLEKRKDKSAIEWLPETSRSPIDNPLKFNFFARNEDKRKEEKRKSGLSWLANISELDREAAEICRKEQAHQQQLLDADDAKFYETEPEIPKRSSTRELISLFNAIGNTNAITVNPSVIESECRESEQQLEVAVCEKPEIKIATVVDLDEKNSKAQTLFEQRTRRHHSPSPTVSTIAEISEPSSSAATLNQYSEAIWVCSRCTLENFVWKTQCDVCSAVKPNGRKMNDRRKSEMEFEIDWERELEKYFPDKKESRDEPVSGKLMLSKTGDVVIKTEQKENDLDELRRKRLAFFMKSLGSDASTSLRDAAAKKSLDEAEKSKLKGMLKEMKDSLPKYEGVKNTLNTAGSKNETLPDVTGRKIDSVGQKYQDSGNYGVIRRKPTEALLVTTTTIHEDIFVRKKPNELKKTRRVGNGPFELMRARDLADIIENKTGNVSPAHVYANYPPPKISDTGSSSSENDTNREMVRLATQLTKASGVAEFKASLDPSDANTLAVNRLLRRLEAAIAAGRHDQAATLARELAGLKVNCCVTRQKPPLSPSPTFITAEMYVEDKVSHQGPIPLKLQKTMTLSDLKIKVQNDFQIPGHVQRWILGKQLATEEFRTLEDFGVTMEKCPIFLYLVAPEPEQDAIPSAPVEENTEANPANKDEEGARAQTPQPPQLGKGWYYNYEEDRYSFCDSDSDQESPKAAAVKVIQRTIEKKKSQSPADSMVLQPPQQSKPFSPKQSRSQRPPLVASVSLPEAAQEESMQAVESQSDKSQGAVPRPRSRSIFDLIKPQANDTLKKDLKVISVNAVKETIEKLTRRGEDLQKNGWKCGMCTLLNATNRMLCSVCFAPRPSGYMDPIKSPVEDELRRLRRDQALDLFIQEPVKIEKQHYLELVNLDGDDVVPNTEPFECPICLVNYDADEGVVLKECLHTFCRPCLAQTVQTNQEAEVKCPFMDYNYSCDCVLQQREIKALVPKEVFEQYLARSVAQAENRMGNAFHCKTPDCKGWCILEDNVNEFPCPVCKHVNCLTCQAIHEGINCKTYQDRLNASGESNTETKRTKSMLEEMVQKGDAMACPTCQVVLMKKWGCDWLRCSMCKTEICWVTRGPRWGPGGKGDTSAGCKCGVNGIKCHPKCNYCH